MSAVTSNNGGSVASHGAHILLVEDNPVTRKMLRVALQIEGYRVEEACDGRSAIAASVEHAPDLVLQDLVLPDMDGFDLIQRLRALPGGAAIPILALSGFVGPIADERTARSDFTAVLVKPVEASILIDAVHTFLPKRSGPPITMGDGRQVLLVDDNAVQLKLLRIHFSHLGFSVTTATSASEALRLARTRPPDLIVSDVLMPDVDGFQLCVEVRRDPALCHVPVVLLTAYYQNGADRDLAKRVGASALLVRNADLSEMIPAIYRAAEAQVPAASEEPNDRIKLEHARAVIRQLDRQLAVSSSLTRRCGLQAAQLSVLGGMADALARNGDTDTALQDVLAATLDAAAISKGMLYLIGPDGALHLRNGIGFADGERHHLDTFFGQMDVLDRIVAGKVAVGFPSPTAPTALSQALLGGAGVSSLDIVPLVSDATGVGAIVLGAMNSDLASEDSVAFTRAIGNQITKSLELERAFARLAASERRQRILMENANDAIFVLTVGGEIREVNRRGEQILGRSRRELVGRNLHDFSTSGHQAENLGAYLKTVAAGGGRGSTELERPDGTTVAMDFGWTVVDLAGERLVFTVGRDITEQLRAQAHLMVSDRMASVGAMAAGVAHEINNPLAAVITNLELAATDLTSFAEGVPQAAEVRVLATELADATEGALRVQEIVRDIRTFSRVEDERPVLVDLHQVLESSLRMAWNEIRHRAELVKEYGAPAMVIGNESRLGQVFLNLLVNAAQAIAEGHADLNEIRVRTRPDQTSGRVVVEIADTGPGIPPEILKKLFTPFFTTKPAGVGTGLGLVICQRIITALGGQISVSSKLGVGTVFRVVLPTATAVQAAKPAAAPELEQPSRRGRVLVVDDDRIVGSAIKRVIQRDHDVELATSAEAALQRLSSGDQFDVILCDVMMPVMTGMELYARLAETTPDLAARMIFLTGGAFTTRARAFLDQIPNSCLDKPFNVQRLRAVINELIL
jgi:PAS domain S-box-containing protein